MQDTKLNGISIEELREIVADILDVEPAQVTMEAGPGSMDSWDSLAHLKIITAVEEAFGVRFDMSEIQSIKSFAALHKAVSVRLAP